MTPTKNIAGAIVTYPPAAAGLPCHSASTRDSAVTSIPASADSATSVSSAAARYFFAPSPLARCSATMRESAVGIPAVDRVINSAYTGKTS